MFILLYHQICEVPEELDPLRLAVSPALFAAEMQFLKKAGYQCLSLERIAAMVARKETVPENAFAITFDDGYQDNFDTAYPLLMQHEFTATIFLVPSRAGMNTKWKGLGDDQSFPLMGWDAVRSLSAAGIDFGSHTQNHAMLTELTEQQVSQELINSKAAIEEELGKPVTMFAFPYEKAEPALQTAVEAAGYAGACGSLLYPQNQFNLWRTECLGTDTMSDFKYKISPEWRRSVEFKYHSMLGRGLRHLKRQAQRLGRGHS